MTGKYVDFKKQKIYLSPCWNMLGQLDFCKVPLSYCLYQPVFANVWLIRTF